MMSTIHCVPALDFILEAVAAPAGEDPAAPIKLRNASTAVDPACMHIADEPRAFAAEAARCPFDRDPAYAIIKAAKARQSRKTQSRVTSENPTNLARAGSSKACGGAEPRSQVRQAIVAVELDRLRVTWLSSQG